MKFKVGDGVRFQPFELSVPKCGHVTEAGEYRCRVRWAGFDGGDSLIHVGFLVHDPRWNAESAGAERTADDVYDPPEAPEGPAQGAKLDDGDARKYRKRSSRGKVLADAADLIHGERNAHYGSPTENFERIAEIWNIQLDNKLKDGEVVTAGDVADLMIAVKLARTVNQPKRDNYVDIAGYAACGWEARGAS